MQACKVHVGCFQAETEHMKLHGVRRSSSLSTDCTFWHDYIMCHSASKAATVSLDRADVS